MSDRSCTSQPVDLMICDLGMPGMNGWEVGKQIRRICAEKGIQKPPFILLTGWGDQAHEERKISEAGVDSVGKKPVDMIELLQAIRQVVRSN